MSLTPRIAETAKEAVEELKSTIYYDYLHGLDHHHPRPRRRRSSTKHSVQPHYQREHLLRCPLKRDRLTRNNRELHLAAYFCLCISTIGRFSLTKPFRYLGFCFKYTISFIYFSLFHTHSNIHSARLFTQKYQLYYFSVTIHLSIHPLSPPSPPVRPSPFFYCCCCLYSIPGGLPEVLNQCSGTIPSPDGSLGWLIHYHTDYLRAATTSPPLFHHPGSPVQVVLVVDSKSQ